MCRTVTHVDRQRNSKRGQRLRFTTAQAVEAEDARRLVEGYVEHYNTVRLYSAVGYVTPKDMLAGRQREIHAERDRKLELARQKRQTRRQQAI